MSISFVPGIIGSAAGSPLAQSKGSDLEKASHDTGTQKRQSESTEKADAASGIGQTSEDQETSDRDADGRRIWEVDEKQPKAEEEETAEKSERKSKDSSGLSGNQLDLSG